MSSPIYRPKSKKVLISWRGISTFWTLKVGWVLHVFRRKLRFMNCFAVLRHICFNILKLVPILWGTGVGIKCEHSAMPLSAMPDVRLETRFKYLTHVYWSRCGTVWAYVQGLKTKQSSLEMYWTLFPKYSPKSTYFVAILAPFKIFRLSKHLRWVAYL